MMRWPSCWTAGLLCLERITCGPGRRVNEGIPAKRELRKAGLTGAAERYRIPLNRGGPLQEGGYKSLVLSGRTALAWL